MSNIMSNRSDYGFIVPSNFVKFHGTILLFYIFIERKCLFSVARQSYDLVLALDTVILHDTIV